MDVHRRLLNRDPVYRANRADIETLALTYQRDRAVRREGVTTIPVVVHVVHHTDEQDVSDAQIASQLAVLNADYGAANGDLDQVPAPWQALIGKADVVFELATVDPAGGVTTGVDRRRTHVAAFDDDDAVKSEPRGGLDAWPADRYLNVWVCPMLDLLGYAQLPGGPTETDGVVIDTLSFGTTGTATPPFHLGRTATHEVGHWLNLLHIWGDDGLGCAGSDLVDDTPNQAGPNTGLPVYPTITCDNAPNGDMFVNFMDYTDDPGMVMFTAGQVARMHAALDGPRASLGPSVPGSEHGPIISHTWQHTDLTAETGAADAAGDPVAVVSGTGDLHIVYRGLDEHIHDIVITDGASETRLRASSQAR